MLRTTFLAATAVLFAVIVLGVGIDLSFGTLPGREGTSKLRAAPAPKPQAEDRFRFLAFEGFDGKLRLNWKPVRSDPAHVSLTKHRGKLTITTQRGTIHADEKARGEPSAKNLFLIDNPLAKDSDFVMTTCISSFTPTVAYQQAGLLCYDDDDNYAKLVYQYNWRAGMGQALVFLRETRGGSWASSVEAEAGLKQVWLRLTKRGKSYEYAASADGKEFTAHGTKEWGDGAPKKLGLIAKNGGPDDVPELEACFEFFELRSPVGE